LNDPDTQAAIAAACRSGTVAQRSALRLVSGANPNNCNCHRQAGEEGADNHQGECEKRICFEAHIVYRHVACSIARINRKAATGTNAVTASSSRTRVQKARSDAARIWLTKG